MTDRSGHSPGEGGEIMIADETGREVTDMKRLCAAVLAIVVVFCMTSLAVAGGWDKCKGCHTDSGKPSPSKADLLKKFKTADEFTKAAKESKSPMMNNFKKDDDLKGAATDIGLK
jgi:hypothetical protein